MVGVCGQGSGWDGQEWVGKCIWWAGVEEADGWEGVGGVVGERDGWDKAGWVWPGEWAGGGAGRKSGLGFSAGM